MATWNLLNLNSAAKAYNQTYSNLSGLQDYFSHFAGTEISNAIQTWNEAKRFNAEQAKINRDFQSKEALLNRIFQAKQADINRDFQAQMSATAHQREVQDLRAAGLSPVLSANAGASTPTGSGVSGAQASGSQASMDSSLVNVFGNLASVAMNAVDNVSQALGNMSTQLVTNVNSANVAKYGNELSTDLGYFTSQLQSITQKEIAHIAGQYGVDQAKIHMYATQYAAEVARDASNFAAKMGYNASWNQLQAQMRNTDENNLWAYKIAQLNNNTSSINTDKQAIVSLIGHVLGLVPG